MTFYFSIPLFRGVAEAALDCAHRATTVSSWGLCEQERAPGRSFPILPSSLVTSQGMGAD